MILDSLCKSRSDRFSPEEILILGNKRYFYAYNCEGDFDFFNRHQCFILKPGAVVNVYYLTINAY